MIRCVRLWTGPDNSSAVQDGTLVFTTREGEQFTLRPGDVLLAEGTEVPFRPTQ